MNWTRLGRTPDHPAGIARYLIRDDHLYVFCDGTRNRQEWLWNVMTRMIRLSDGSRANKVDWEQAQQVATALYAALDLWRFNRVTVAGLSRGGAIAVLVAWILSPFIVERYAEAFAGKRVGNRKLMDGVHHSNTWYRGDIVPWLPFRYASYRGWMVVGDWKWPWDAHMDAAHTAARWRHRIDHR